IAAGIVPAAIYVKLQKMDESTPKEKVLKKIRNALINKKDNPYSGLDLESPIYVINEEDPLVLFANTFTDKGGKFL
ncbi:MAG TPA: hypothetical protein PKE52_10280, partial [Bacteroidales bacterium]|nr:hypothetical protein [Bacteroidales bacterium]